MRACTRHGGAQPRRCGVETESGPCTKCALSGGPVRACVEHGGGQRCAVEDCKSLRQVHGFCRRHGGSRFCKAVGCRKTDQGGGLVQVSRRRPSLRGAELWTVSLASKYKMQETWGRSSLHLRGLRSSGAACHRDIPKPGRPAFVLGVLHRPVPRLREVEGQEGTFASCRAAAPPPVAGRARHAAGLGLPGARRLHAQTPRHALPPRGPRKWTRRATRTGAVQTRTLVSSSSRPTWACPAWCSGSTPTPSGS